MAGNERKYIWKKLEDVSKETKESTVVKSSRLNSLKQIILYYEKIWCTPKPSKLVTCICKRLNMILLNLMML